MKKLFNAVFLSATMFGLGALPTFARNHNPLGDWSLKSPQEMALVCDGSIYTHKLTSISIDKDGNFTGSGEYANDNAYTWDISGKIEGTKVTFTLVYTGVDPGYTLNGSGSIDSDGSITGTLDGNCETFSMQAVPVEEDDQAKKDNHGQYVKSQDDKKAAAHSRVGMPEQSKGHTK